MLKIHHILLSKDASVDRLTNQTSVYNLVEEINAPTFPARLHAVSLVILVSREKNDKITYDAKIEAMVNKEKVGGAEFLLDFQNKEKRRNRIIIKFPEMGIKAPGTLTYDFYLDGKVVGTLQLDIIQKQPAEQQAKLI